MTKDEQFYLQIESMALNTALQSGLMDLLLTEPAKGFLFLFDSAYAMGFGACQKMTTDGVDVHQLDVQTLSLIPDNERERHPAGN